MRGTTDSDVPSTLTAALERAAEVEIPGPVFLDVRLRAREWTWAQIAAEANARASHFTSLGMRAGDRLGLLVNDEQEFVLAFLGAVAAGVVPVPMYPPAPLGNAESQLRRACGILNASSADWLLGSSELQATSAALADACERRLRVIDTESLVALARCAPPAFSASPDTPCLLQFTSGSTADPKGVVVTHGNAVANMRAAHQRFGSDPERDVGVNWVPLYHDMGLIGAVITPLLSLGREVFIPTLTFAARPRVLLEVVHRYRGTMFSTNNFGLRAMAKRAPSIPDLDLSSLRVIVIGAEPIHVPTVERFVEMYRPFGLKPEVMTPAYGLAESTLAVAACEPQTRPRVLHLARRGFELGQRADDAAPGSGQGVFSVGAPVPDHEVVITQDGHGAALPERHVGEIWVRGPSVTPGYFGEVAPGTGEEQTRWLRTGDLGFLEHGELFVTGRLKELIILAGRNYHPQTFEWAAGAVDGVRADHVIAFSVPAEEGEALVVLAECKHPGRTAGLSTSIRRAIRADTGVDAASVCVLPPWQLPKTSSGKLQRGLAKRYYLDGHFETFAQGDSMPAHSSRSEHASSEQGSTR